MKLIGFGMLFAALAFCGLTDKLKQMSGGTANNASSSSNSNTNTASKGGSEATVEPAKPSSEQQAIIEGGTDAGWGDQGLSWRVPAGWKKTDSSKTSFDYASADNAFLLVNISELGDNFPMETSLKAYYDQAMQQLRSGKYESVKMVSIDGLSGVEFTEAAPPGKDDVRRHQWIGYRRYLGQVQQVNVMTSTKASNFAKHADDFTAILYSMKQE